MSPQQPKRNRRMKPRDQWPSIRNVTPAGRQAHAERLRTKASPRSSPSNLPPTANAGHTYHVGPDIAPKARRMLPRGKLIGAGAGVLVGAGGAGYLINRSRQQKEPAVKSLVDPFNEVVVFGKAYPVVDTTMGVRSVGTLYPTGKGVGHGLRLTQVHNSKGHGGRRPGLERYSKSDKTRASSGAPSTGREAATYFFPGAHGVVAGKKGHKFGAGAREYGSALLGAVPGTALSLAGRRSPALSALGGTVSMAGGLTAAHLASNANNRAGRYKRQEAGKGTFSSTQPLTKSYSGMNFGSRSYVGRQG